MVAETEDLAVRARGQAGGAVQKGGESKQDSSEKAVNFSDLIRQLLGGGGEALRLASTGALIDISPSKAPEHKEAKEKKQVKEKHEAKHEKKEESAPESEVAAPEKQRYETDVATEEAYEPEQAVQPQEKEKVEEKVSCEKVADTATPVQKPVEAAETEQQTAQVIQAAQTQVVEQAGETSNEEGEKPTDQARAKVNLVGQQATVAQQAVTEEASAAVTNSADAAKNAQHTRARVGNSELTAQVLTAPSTPEATASNSAAEVQDQVSQQTAGDTEDTLTAQALRLLHSQGASVPLGALNSSVGGRINLTPLDSASKAIAALTAVADFGSDRATEAKTANISKLTQANQAKVIERIQKIAEEISHNKVTNSVVVRLDPPELGELTVKITKRSDHLFARISAESPDVEAALKARIQDVSQALTNAGFRVEQVHVSVGQEQPDAQYTPFEGFLGQRNYSGEKRANESKDGGSVGGPASNEAAQKGSEQDVQAGWVA